jgi:alpha-L-fucosidase
MIKQLRILLLSIMVALTFVSLRSQEIFQPSWKSLSKYQCPEWFRDAKFGIFIHWGVYSVPAFGSEWYPRHMYDDTINWGLNYYAYHVKNYGTPDKFGYKDFIPLFTADKFNADQWVDLFKKAGAKYIVPVAEHHDGFAMYNTSLSRWNAASMGPKMDIIGELADASRKQGLIFGLSSHRLEHWWFMNKGRNIQSDVNDPQFEDFYGPATPMDPFVAEKRVPISTEFMNDWLLRCTELVDKYHPQVFWFDWYIEQPEMEPYRKSFASYYYNHANQWGKEVVINYKDQAFPENVAVYDIERGSSKATKKYPWQTDTSIGKKSWGYIKDEENKTPNEIIDALIDIVSKNGNLLLNIGPRPDGTITPEQTNVLLAIGKWLDVNGEAIYGTRPWIISGEGPTESPAENIQFNEYSNKPYTAQDIRFTTKGDALFAICLDIPKEPVKIKTLGLTADPDRKIKNIQLLGSTEIIKWSQKKEALKIDLPKSIPCENAIAFKILY